MRSDRTGHRAAIDAEPDTSPPGPPAQHSRQSWAQPTTIRARIDHGGRAPAAVSAADSPPSVPDEIGARQTPAVGATRGRRCGRTPRDRRRSGPASIDAGESSLTPSRTGPSLPGHVERLVEDDDVPERDAHAPGPVFSRGWSNRTSETLPPGRSSARAGLGPVAPATTTAPSRACPWPGAREPRSGRRRRCGA